MCFKQLDNIWNMSLPDMEWAIFERAGAECFPHLRRIALSVAGEPLLSPNIFRELEVKHYDKVPKDQNGSLTLEGAIAAGYTNENVRALKEAGAAFPKAFDYGIPQLGESLIPDDDIKWNSCLYPWREAFIEWNGEVTPCCSPALFEAGRMGNLHDKSFAEIWNGEYYKRLRRSIREGRTYMFCRHCHLVNPEDPEAYCLA